MKRQKKPWARCLICYMRQELCICEAIKECRRYLEINSNNKTKPRIEILMHHRERHLPTNTGRIAALSIPDCNIHFRGLLHKPLDTSKLLTEEREALLLFPSDDAHVLNDDFLTNIKKPITLIVPDGSWRQAFKVSTREEALKKIPRVVLEAGKASEYKLRREPKENGLATFEAIARAMGVLESNEAQKKLEEVFFLMVERTLKSRGYRNPETKVT